MRAVVGVGCRLCCRCVVFFVLRVRVVLSIHHADDTRIHKMMLNVEYESRLIELALNS